MGGGGGGGQMGGWIDSLLYNQWIDHDNIFGERYVNFRCITHLAESKLCITNSGLETSTKGVVGLM